MLYPRRQLLVLGQGSAASTREPPAAAAVLLHSVLATEALSLLVTTRLLTAIYPENSRKREREREREREGPR